jgi:regulator of replication initiation timing
MSMQKQSAPPFTGRGKGDDRMENTATTAASLLENEYVKELLAVMEANRVPAVKDLLAVFNQVSAMERQLDTAVTELAALRRELSTSQKQAHPVKAALQNTGAAMEKSVIAVRDRLDATKQAVIDSCKNAVDAFREKGISALDNITRFFKLRPMLETMRTELDKSIRADRSAMDKIETVSAEYHEAGRHIKNMGRTLMGNEAAVEAKPMGKLAKSLEAPFKAELSCLSSMKKSVGKALLRLTALEQSAQRKPSVQQNIHALSEKLAREQKSAPAAEKSRSVSHEAR